MGAGVLVASAVGVDDGTEASPPLDCGRRAKEPKNRTTKTAIFAAPRNPRSPKNVCRAGIGARASAKSNINRLDTEGMYTSALMAMKPEMTQYIFVLVFM